MRLLLFLIVSGSIFFSMLGCQKQPPSPTPESGRSARSDNTTPLSTAPAQTHDGPFGLASGVTIAELERLKFKQSSTNANVFNGTPPKPLQGVSSYLVVATPSVGLCRISAMVDVPTVNGSGDQVRAEVDRLADMMAVKYGKHSDKVDFVKEDVYRRNPHYWMLGLKEESVVYAYDWEAAKIATNLPHMLDNIEIAANASSTSEGYVTVRYTFKNFEKCAEEMRAQKAANL